MPRCLVLCLSICYVRNKAMRTFRESFNLLGSSFDNLSVLRNLRVLPKAGSLDFEGWRAKRVSNCAACMPVCVRACGLRVRACVQVQLRRSIPQAKPIGVGGGSLWGEVGACISPSVPTNITKLKADGLGLRLFVINLANVVRFRSRSLRHVPLGIIWRTDTPSSHV